MSHVGPVACVVLAVGSGPLKAQEARKMSATRDAVDMRFSLWQYGCHGQSKQHPGTDDASAEEGAQEGGRGEGPQRERLRALEAADACDDRARVEQGAGVKSARLLAMLWWLEGCVTVIECYWAEAMITRMVWTDGWYS